MKNDNRGFSLVEMIVVLAIMALLASLGMLSFNAANSQKPSQMRSDFISSGKYERQKTMAEEADQCMLLLKAQDGYYYVIYGYVPSSVAKDQQHMLAAFKSLCETEDSSGNAVRDASGEKSADQLVTDPKSAQNYQALNNNIKVTVPDGTEGISVSGKGYGWVIQFSKFDGSVLIGDGEYQFSKYRNPSEVKCSTRLIKSTGVFRTN